MFYFDIAYFTFMIIVLAVSALVRYKKRGLSIICKMVAVSYLTSAFISFLVAESVTYEQYLLLDIARLTIISTILFYYARMSLNAKHYVYYSIVLTGQCIANSSVLFGVMMDLESSLVLTKNGFVSACMTIMVLELVIFGYGIKRDLKANTGKRDRNIIGINSYFSGCFRFICKYANINNIIKKRAR